MNPPNSDTLAFRADINGLRAWAVAIVLLFHFGVAGFDAGFIGVDIFFVISGYLMTRIITRGLLAGGFSFYQFSLARMRRIVPALIVFLLILLLLGIAGLPALALKDLAQQAGFATVFFSNMLFWSTAGYFDTAAHEKWLLHTWSLGVEMQFYLLFPLILLVVWKLWPKQRFLWAALLVIFIGSFLVNIQLHGQNPVSSFYLLPLRSWELVAGGLVYAVGQHWQPKTAIANILFAIGWGLLLASMLLVNSALSWPSALALFPVVGTALVILAARTSNRLLSCRASQWLGNTSYSLYLWHWPLVVLLNYLGLQKQWGWVIAAMAVSLVCGYVSFVLVETPTRKRLINYSTLNQTLILGGATATILICALISNHWSNYTIGEVDNLAVDSASWINDPCFTHEENNENPYCLFGGANVRAYLIGDSHALALRSAFLSTLHLRNTHFGLKFWARSGCPTIKDAIHSPYSKRPTHECRQHNDTLLEWLEHDDSKTPAVLLSRTSLAVAGFNEIPGKSYPFMAFEGVSEKLFPKVFEEKLVQTACQIAKKRPVYMVRPIPEMGLNVPIELAKRQLSGHLSPDITLPLDSYHRRHALVWQAQDRAAHECGIKILNPLPYLCDDTSCYGSKDGQPLYFDGDHLNQAGSALLIPMFDHIFSPDSL